MSMVILEAISMKVPVIASRVPGNIEFFRSINKYEDTFRNNTVELSSKIIERIKYYKRFQKEATNLRKLVLKKYSNFQMFENYKKLVIKILNNSK